MTCRARSRMPSTPSRRGPTSRPSTSWPTRRSLCRSWGTPTAWPRSWATSSPTPSSSRPRAATSPSRQGPMPANPGGRPRHRHRVRAAAGEAPVPAVHAHPRVAAAGTARDRAGPLHLQRHRRAARRLHRLPQRRPGAWCEFWFRVPFQPPAQRTAADSADPPPSLRWRRRSPSAREAVHVQRLRIQRPAAVDDGRWTATAWYVTPATWSAV